MAAGTLQWLQGRALPKAATEGWFSVSDDGADRADIIEAVREESEIGHARCRTVTARWRP